MKALVVGLGMGQQYVTWFKELGYDCITVDTDPKKMATYTSIEQALENKRYRFVYVGTPNHTHEAIARQCANHCDILLIEKPGFKCEDAWRRFISDYPTVRIMMVKNNQYRSETADWSKLADISCRIDISWVRKQGIPQSAWFTNNQQSYGGVSRDLMPHLLSYFTLLSDYKNSQVIFRQLNDPANIGTDTEAYLEIQQKKQIWRFRADWQSTRYNDHSLVFRHRTKSYHIDLGELCPADPYKRMIQTANNEYTTDKFWQEQLRQDAFIHNIMERLCW